jgi:hypothetical protein
LLLIRGHRRSSWHHYDMDRLRWALRAIVFCAFGLSILQTYLPGEGGPFGSKGRYGDAAYVAFVVGAALWPRGIVWVLAIGFCALATVVYLMAAISLPGDTIRWLFAGAYAIEALALFALGTADRHSRDLGAQPAEGHSERPPVDRQ